MTRGYIEGTVLNTDPFGGAEKRVTVTEDGTKTKLDVNVDFPGSMDVNVTNSPLTVDGSVDANIINQPVSVDGSVDANITNSSIAVTGTVTANVSFTGLITVAYDYVSLSYTGSDLTGVVFKTGGAGGTTVATLVLAYSSGNLVSVTKT